MTCDGCARHVSEALRGVRGVVQAQVPGRQSGRALVSALGRVSDGDLIEAVHKSGYYAVLETRRPVERQRRMPETPKADYDLMIVGGGSAAAARDTRGLIELVADAETDRQAGAHVLAAQAGEIIQEATLAIRFGSRSPTSSGRSIPT